MSLQTRVKRLEVVAGGVAGITEQKFREAMELLTRYGDVRVSKILHEAAGCDWVDPNPTETALLMIAEKSGQIDAARDIERRYWRARGIDIEERARRGMEIADQRLAALKKAVARFPVRTADEAGGAPDAEP